MTSIFADIISSPAISKIAERGNGIGGISGILQKTGAAVLIASSLLLVGCASGSRNQMIISAADQKMVLLRDGKPTRTFPVSTSKFGLGDARGSYATPLGKLRVRKKSAATCRPEPFSKAACPPARFCR